MLLAALKLQLAALVTVAGINTDQVKSTPVKSALEGLAKAQEDAAKGSGGDVNKALTDAVEAIKKAADADDADANYALASWARKGIISGLDGPTVLKMYEKAAKSNVQAKTELGALYIQNFPQDAEKVKAGVELIKTAESADEPAARRVLAQLTLQGVADIVKRDVSGAVALLKKGSAAKDGEATYTLAQIYAAGISETQADGSAKPVIEKSEAEALKYLKTAAIDQKYAPAMNDYATRLFSGDAKGEGKDPKAAMDMFNDAVKQGSAAASRQLGLIFEQGLGGQDKSTDKAFANYLAGARGGDGVAQLWMGNVTQNGLLSDAGVAKAKKAQDDKKQPELKAEDVLVAPNPSQALTWYRLAAQGGLPQAVYNVGVFYENGAVVDRDLTKAFALVQRAAVSGIPVAAYRLASYYQQGVGIAQDPVAAAAWFKRSAEGGLPAGQLVYGALLENGAGGVEKNLQAAALQYEKAAEAGLAQAMANLAVLYGRGGDGLKADNKKAWAWAALAIDAANGSKEAKEFRDKLEGGMSKAEIADATKMYEDMKAKAKSAASGTPAPAADAAPAPASSSSTSKSKKAK